MSEKEFEERILQLESTISTILSRVYPLEEEIIKFYRNKEKCFYERYGDDIENRICIIEEWLDKNRSIEIG